MNSNSAKSSPTPDFSGSEIFVHPAFSARFIWDKGLLTCIRLRPGMAEKNSKETVSPWHNTLKNLVQGYKKPCWPELPLDWSRTTSFSRRVLTTLQKHVPAGRWTTYKELARLCGSPGAARAVGRTMACNPWPLYIPCHRVLPTTGGIGNFGQGPKLKQTLLLLEGACLPE